MICLRRPLVILLTVSALAASACGPPQEPLHVGMREVASNVVLGGGEDEVVAGPVPIPPTAISVTVPQPTKVGTAPPADSGPSGPPADGGPAPAATPGSDDGDDQSSEPPDGDGDPQPPPDPPPSPAPPVCEKGDPRESPEFESRRDSMVPPVPAIYEYRNKGGFEVSGADTNEGTFDEPTQRHVKNVIVADDGSFAYSVAATLGATVTTTRYEYRATATVPSDVTDQTDAVDDRGLYLDWIETQDGESQPRTFDPPNNLLLLPVPATDGFSTDVAGTDPTSGTTMSYRLTVVGKQRVDACGEQLDAIRVTLTDGRYTAPTSAVDFTATYDIGTQYGGLMLRDAFVTAGREGLNNVSRNNVAIINRAPRAGKGAR